MSKSKGKGIYYQIQERGKYKVMADSEIKMTKEFTDALKTLNKINKKNG